MQELVQMALAEVRERPRVVSEIDRALAWLAAHPIHEWPPRMDRRAIGEPRKVH